MQARFLNAALMALAGAAFVPTAAQAHGAWLAHIHGEKTVMYGHGESDSDPYDPARVVRAQAFRNGNSLPVRIVPHPQRYATLQADKPGLLAFTLDNRYWYKNRQGKWFNEAKTAAPSPADVAESAHSVKYSVAYLNNREPVRPMGHALEIVPSVNPAKLKKGDKLAVQVLFQGKPLAGASVSNNFFGEHQDAKTDASGRAELPIARAGMNALSVSHEAPMSDKRQADTFSAVATLSFETPHDDHQH